MVNKLISIILILFTAFPAFAEEAYYLEKTKPAPYTGFLFSPEKTQEIRKTYLEHENYKLINESLKSSLDFQVNIIKQKSEQLNLSMERNTVLAKELRDERSMGDLERIGWFALGIIATGVAGYGISRIK